MSQVIVIIPVRYAATRLPGKPLRDIAGMPMIKRTALQAKQSGLPVWVAYDDERIAKALSDTDVSLIQTQCHHENGTERLSEVAMAQKWNDDVIVVNVQGDEPLMPPALIEHVAQTLVDAPWAEVATLAAPFDRDHSPTSSTTVKVVCDDRGRALYFSRSPIPYVRDAAGGFAEDYPYMRHIGIYAYRVSVLKKYPKMQHTPLEQAEKLEQLRFLEHGIDIAVGTVAQAPPTGVDCEEDLARVNAILRASSNK